MRPSPRPVFYLLALALFAIDQATKAWALATLGPSLSPEGVFHRTVIVLPGFFNLSFAANTGIAFSLLRGGNAWVLVATAIGLVGAALVVWRFRPVDWTPLGTNVIAAMIVAGACGNLVDRARHGYVVDFLDFYWGASHYPTFNVADSCIVLAVVWLVWRGLVSRPA
jgi:signal peptidase II